MIRHARHEDDAQVRQLLGRVWEDDYVADHWNDWLDKPDEGIPLAAVSDERVIGIAYLRFLDERVAWFMALRVDPDFRRYGIGTALSQACLQHALQAGREVSRLLIDTENYASQAMTERAGFRRIFVYDKLIKPVEETTGPLLAQPEAARLPLLLQLAKQQGLRYLHWKATHDLRLDAMQHAWRDGGLRVLPGEAEQAYVVVSYQDTECEVYDPVGDSDLVLELLLGVEQEAGKRGLSTIEVFLPPDSPLYTTLVERGGFRPVDSDGFTIWEYDL